MFSLLSISWVLLGSLTGCAPEPASAPATIESATPSTPPEDTGAIHTADTGDTDTDVPAPSYTCDGDGDPVLMLGEEEGTLFEPFHEPVDFPFASGQIQLTLRTEGLDTNEPVLVVVRVGEPGENTTDTIGQRWLVCGDHRGWVTLEARVPNGVGPGDAVQVSATLTDHRHVSTSAELAGSLD